FLRPSATRPSQSSSVTCGCRWKYLADALTRAQCSARSGVTPSKARAPSNTSEPSQPAWVRGPKIGTLPSCQSPSKKVQVLDHVAAMGPLPQRASLQCQLQCQGLARRGGPVAQVETVRREQGEGEAVDAEGDAAGVDQLAGRGRDLPGLAEVLAVIVEAHAGG